MKRSHQDGPENERPKKEKNYHDEIKAETQVSTIRRWINEPPPLIYNDELNDPLECIYEYLSIKDLSQLSLVSLRFNEAINTFVSSQLKRLQQSDTISENLQLYLSEEVNLKENIFSLPCLKQYALAKKWQKLCRRSISQCHCTWLEDPRYFSINYSEKLNRMIVDLIQVCWLNIQWTFTGVIPGKYEFKIRLDVSRGYPSTDGTNIFIEWEDKDGNHQENVKLERSNFNKLKKLRKGNVMKIKNGEALNYEDGFFDIVLSGIYISSRCNVKGGLQDCNGQWKTDMRFDYIELTPIDG